MRPTAAGRSVAARSVRPGWPSSHVRSVEVARMSDDWRATAYLSIENWPEAIPWTGPARQGGPLPWRRPSHEHEDIDRYPLSHPAATTLGGLYMGDVCPMCGVPLRYDERVVGHDGQRGDLHEVSRDTAIQACYHPDCWTAREATLAKRSNYQLTDF